MRLELSRLVLRCTGCHLSAGNVRPFSAKTIEGGGKTPKSPARTSPNLCQLAFSPFRYAAGSWLRLNQEHHDARFISFDFDKLCEKAIACSAGAHKVIQCDKIEGGYNRAFILHFDNGSSVVARIPFAVSGPPKLRTNSEVATMEYVRRHTSVPVPTVLDWSDNSSNPIGTEYIIMSMAPGVQLHERWDSMNTPEHFRCVKSLGEMAGQMAKLRFPAYGSIYYSDVQLESADLIPLSDGFCIGPHCGQSYWPCTPGDPRFYQRRAPNLGPWKTHEQFCGALIDLQISRIPEKVGPGRTVLQGSIEDHLRLAEITEDVLKALVFSPQMSNIAEPLLLHADLHKRNIFVSNEDPSKITCLIDWQSTSIEPSWIYANEIPDLCVLDRRWRVIENSDDVRDEKAESKARKDAEICQQTWSVSLGAWIPKLHTATQMDDDYFRLMRSTPSAWRHGVTAIYHDLYHLSNRWNSELQLPGTCPYQPTPEDAERHQRLWTEHEDMLNLKTMVMNTLNTDPGGWVAQECWEETQSAHQLLYQTYMNEFNDSGELTEEQASALWPFDPPSTID